MSSSTGGALVAALLLVAVSAVMGATILFATSTDIQISGNYRRAIQAFYAAEAGLAETRMRLGGSPSTNPGFLPEFGPIIQHNWSVYVVSRLGWRPQDDPDFSTQFTNYFPVPGNLTNTEIVPNSIQTLLPYWTKVRHKTEFDSEQRGHSLVTPHYRDLDGVTTSHSKSHQGNLVFYGYTGDQDLQPISFTSLEPTPYTPIDIIVSHSEVEGAVSHIQVEVAHPPGPPLLAPLYINNQFSVLGGSATIQGHDRCGLLPGGRPPVWFGPEGSIEGNPALFGNPSTSQMGLKSLDLSKVLDELGRNGQVTEGNLLNLSVGTPENPAWLSVQSQDNGFSNEHLIHNLTGFGILLVRGNVKISSPFYWEGLVVVSGQVMFDGGIGTSSMYGAFFADQVQVLSGEMNITFDSCPVSASLRALPVSILNWHQIL